MARLPRYFIPDQPQHVIQRGNSRQAIFAKEQDYRFYLDCLKDAAGDHGSAIHAYVLMTNHVHLLVTPGSSDSLPKTLQAVGRRYVPHFNRETGRSGALWEGRYRATLIDSESYLLGCYRYIEQNPVRAGMVAHPRDYPWSSFNHNAYGQTDALVTEHDLYRRLGGTPGERQDAYRGLFRLGASEAELAEIRQAIHRGWALGSDRFMAQVQAQGGRRVRPLPRGRPKMETD